MTNLVRAFALVSVGMLTYAGAAAGATEAKPERLVKREGADGVVVLVPKSWTLEIISGGGSASQSVWTNPERRRQTITVTVGTASGGWFEVDGVAGSISPPLSERAKIKRLSVNEFRYVIPPKRGELPVRGVWIGRVVEGSPAQFDQLEVVLPKSEKKRAERIIEAYVKTANRAFEKFLTSTTVPVPATAAPPSSLVPGTPCTLGSNRDCIDPDADGRGTYLIGGGDCVAALGPHNGLCEDLDGDGYAGYPDSG